MVVSFHFYEYTCFVILQNFSAESVSRPELSEPLSPMMPVWWGVYTGISAFSCTGGSLAIIKGRCVATFGVWFVILLCVFWWFGVVYFRRREGNAATSSERKSGLCPQESTRNFLQMTMKVTLLIYRV